METWKSLTVKNIDRWDAVAAMKDKGISHSHNYKFFMPDLEAPFEPQYHMTPETKFFENGTQIDLYCISAGVQANKYGIKFDRYAEKQYTYHLFCEEILEKTGFKKIEPSLIIQVVLQMENLNPGRYGFITYPRSRGWMSYIFEHLVPVVWVGEYRKVLVRMERVCVSNEWMKYGDHFLYEHRCPTSWILRKAL